MRKIHKKRFYRHVSGLTLVEVLIAFALLGLLAAGILLSAPQLRSVVLRTELTQRAGSIANTTMENLRTMSFDQLETHFNNDAYPVTHTVTWDSYTYTVTTNLTRQEFGGVDDRAFGVDVTVEWQPYGFGTRSKHFWTLLTSHGVSDKKFFP